MGKIDTLTKDYISNNAVFADAYNYYVYDGKRVIQPEQLKDLDPTQITVPYGANGEMLPVQKFRDKMKGWTMKVDDSNIYLLLAIENQSKIHYAMPVRNMVYDALQYANQVEETAKKHKEDKRAGLQREGKITADEYLSGFFKSDRLTPVITLVIYFGSEPWDGPETLHEMFRVRDKEILSLVPDYKLNLIAPARMTNEEMDKLNTDLREVLMYIKYSKDKTRLREIVNENERFRHLEQKAFRVINAVTNSELFAETKEGEVNMCQAIDEMRKDAYEEGRASMSNAIAEMRKDAYEEGRASMSNAIAEMRKDAYEEGRASMNNAIAEMRKDAYEEGRASMNNAIAEMRKDAYEEGRASMSNAIAEMRKDAYEEGRASMSNAIAEMRKDAYEEGRASVSNEIAEMRRDAWREGNQAGANENTRIVVENMLKKNMTDQFIMEIADITKEKLSQIKEGFCGMSK